MPQRRNLSFPCTDSGANPPNLVSVQKRRNLVSVQKGAEYSGLSDKTIRRYISTGQLTGYRIGKKLIRVDLDELDALLKPIPTVGSGGQ
jgi:excisionase family DNA binding protein